MKTATSTVPPPVQREVTDANGEVVLSLYTSRLGLTEIYLEAAGDPAFRTQLIHYSGPFLAHSGFIDWGILTRATSNAGSAGTPTDPSLGHLIVTISSCSSSGQLRTLLNAGAGIRLDVTPQHPLTRIRYVRGLQISETATATDSTGVGVALNLPPGYVTITTSRAETGEPIGTLSAIIRADALTGALVIPSPQPL